MEYLFIIFLVYCAFKSQSSSGKTAGSSLGGGGKSHKAGGTGKRGGRH